jgi:hypothetical protein
LRFWIVWLWSICIKWNEYLSCKWCVTK